MELSRRGMLGGFAAVGAVGVAGFAGATSVGNDDAGDGEDGGDGTEETDSVAVDPDAPFVARLLDANDDEERRLFDAGDLARVQGPLAEDGEHLVYVALDDAGVDAFHARLEDAGATENPSGFVVSMRLDETEVRRVTLDEQTVDALTDEEWGGVLTLPFDEETVAEDVHESLAAA